HIGLHVSRRNQPDLVAESGDLARPIVRPAARLHAHKTRRLPGEIGKQLGTAELAPHLNRPVRADAVDLENRLRQVQPDRDNLLHGTVLSLPERPTISSPWHRMPQSRGRSTPSTHRRVRAVVWLLAPRTSSRPAAHRDALKGRTYGRTASRPGKSHIKILARRGRSTYGIRIAIWVRLASPGKEWPMSNRTAP